MPRTRQVVRENTRSYYHVHHSSIFSDSPEIKKKKTNLVEKGYKLDMKSHVCGYRTWI